MHTSEVCLLQVGLLQFSKCQIGLDLCPIIWYSFKLSRSNPVAPYREGIAAIKHVDKKTSAGMSKKGVTSMRSGSDRIVSREEDRVLLSQGAPTFNQFDINWQEMVVTYTRMGRGSLLPDSNRLVGHEEDSFCEVPVALSSGEDCAIRELSFMYDEWPFETLDASEDDDQQVDIVVTIVASNVERHPHQRVEWNQISQQARDMLRRAYPLCGCGAARSPKGQPHCGKQVCDRPATEDSLQALAAKFGGRR